MAVNKLSEDKKQNLLVRVLSAVMLTVILILTLIPGGNVLFIPNCLISFVGIMEFMRAGKVHKSPLAVVAYIGTAGIYALLFFNKKEYLMPLFVMYMIVLFAFFVFRFPKYEPYQVLMVFAGLLYVSFGLSFIYQTREFLPNGKYLVWLMFICSWISDSGAYLAGIFFGKHPAFPKLSPKKSIEGCVGGILFSILLGIIYRYVLLLGFEVDFLSLPIMIIFCFCGSIISQLGDLVASAFKRFLEIKDYGHLIPGHGGIMDRFDSIIFVAPIIYYLSMFFA